MKLGNFEYREFSMLKEALKEKKEKIWKETYVFRLKGAPTEDIKKSREMFDNERNPWRDYGVCNTILERFNNIDEKLQMMLEAEGKK